MSDNDTHDVFIPVGEDGYYSVSEFESRCVNESLSIFDQNIRSFNQNLIIFQLLSMTSVKL